MPTATLTWSETPTSSNPLSTFGATPQGIIQLLNQYFIALSGNADFPWTVASYEGTTSPWQVTLKRKSGAAGRILFVATSSAPGTTYNPQLGSYNWNVSYLRSGFFPEATSDTPANILATSGDVFTNPGNGSGLGPSLNMITTTNSFICWACEDGVLVQEKSSAGQPATSHLVGMMAEDAAGDAKPIAMCYSSSIFGLTPQSSLSMNYMGAATLVGGVSIHYGSGWIPYNAPHNYLRDNALKKAWFFPVSLATYMRTGADIYSWKLRQIAYGPTPLAGHERLVTAGGSVKAISVHPNATVGYPWLVNFKV